MNTFRRYGRALMMSAAVMAIVAGSAAGQTDITEKFKDATFKAWVYNKIGKTAPAPILDSDVRGITYVSVGWVAMDGYEMRKITDLSGIEYFTALTELVVSDNRLTALDVSNNTALTYLDCSGNKLTSLDVSNNTALKWWLNCSGNQLTALDVSKNTKLVTLYCGENKLTALDVSKNPALENLDVRENYLANKSDIIGLKYLIYFGFNPQRDPNTLLASSRVIPSVIPSVETSSVAPVSALSVGFAAGPNPVARSFGSVNFFRVGAVIKSADLSVYDASGNVVRRISVNDGGASGVRSSRKVSSWDLRDASGRLVSAGAYLVRGAVVTKDGSRESVGVVVGVR